MVVWLWLAVLLSNNSFSYTAHIKKPTLKYTHSRISFFVVDDDDVITSTAVFNLLAALFTPQPLPSQKSMNECLSLNVPVCSYVYIILLS